MHSSTSKRHLVYHPDLPHQKESPAICDGIHPVKYLSRSKQLENFPPSSLQELDHFLSNFF